LDIDNATETAERLKNRVLAEVFPLLAQGFWEDCERRRTMVRRPTEQDLADIFEATVTLLYRLLFLLHAESRKLLPVHEAPYREASLLKIMADIAEQAGTVESETAARLADPWSATETTLYDRLARLCRAIDRGEPTLNVPACRGGLFASLPSPAGRGAGGEGFGCLR
jgi:hypothetical protein